MPTNLNKIYNDFLELLYPSVVQNLQSLNRVFRRDFCINVPVLFNQVPVFPTPVDGEDSIERLFRHLTTVVTDEKTKKREFESQRSIRLHWIRFHLNRTKPNNVVTFLVEDENRVYILDKDERYVVVLEPLRKLNAFYLLTAYKLQDSNYRKIMNKYSKRGEVI